MATTPVQFEAPSGLTLTIELYPYGSDSIANGAGGDSATEQTNMKGLYSADVTEAVSGLHNARIKDGSGNTIATYHVRMADDTSIHRCGDFIGHRPENWESMGIENDGHAHADVKEIEGSDATDQINAAADQALTDYDPPTKAELDAAFTEIKGATWSSSTDTLEALRDRGDSAWVTATGFSTHSAGDVWTVGTRTLTGLGFTLVSGDFGASSLDGKGDWSTHGDPDPNGYIANLNGHTAQSGDTFAQLPTNFADLAITASTGRIQLQDGAGTGQAGWLVDLVWDEVLTGATHNVASSAGRRLRQINDLLIIRSNTAQAGGANTITLDSGASSTDGFYKGTIIRIKGGTGQEQSRAIVAYNGTTKVATVDEDWDVQPDGTSEFEITIGRAFLAQTTHDGATIPTVTDVTNAVTILETTNAGNTIITTGNLNLSGGVAESNVKQADGQAIQQTAGEFHVRDSDGNEADWSPVYQAKIELTVDDANGQDEYTAQFYKDGVPVTSGVTGVTIQVIKRSDGTDLVASSSMTEVASTGAFKHDESTNRVTAGEAVVAVVSATIDGGSRTFRWVLGRDSSS